MAEPDARPGPVRRIVDPLADFLHEEAAGGLALAFATIVALIWANVGADGYASVWAHELDIGLGDAALRMDLRHWVNDALMAVFFFVVGLEIKRELVCGELRDRRAAALPVIAALGGVALPALIFVAITAGTPDASGWAIPAATDIAFAVGVLALLGDRVSSGVKLFLLTLAIVDDIVAIPIIAVFYADGLSLPWLAAALCGLAAVVALRRLGVARIAPYVLLGARRLGRGARVGRARHDRRRRARPADPDRAHRRAQRAELLEHRLHAVQRVRDRAAVRARERRRELRRRRPRGRRG